MFDPHSLLLFAGASLVLLIVPGPAVLYIVARSAEQGPVAGLVAVLGAHIGTVVHIAAAGLGLSAVLMSSSVAFAVVKYAGAAYLVYLGVRTLMARDAPGQSRSGAGRRGYRTILAESILVNTLNPKTALFFFAFLPQFVDPAAGSVVAQIVVLGTIFIILGIISDGLYALGAGTAGELVRSRGGFRNATRYATGSVLVGLGLAAVVMEPDARQG